MKPFLALLLLTATAFAETADKIAEDYRKAAAAALTRVNETLEKASVPILAELVKSGDTATAEQLREQVKAKAAGDPVAQPLKGVTTLFQSYDAARAKALQPAQKAAITRIEAALASSDGKKIETVTALGELRAEIESGKVELASAVGIESRLKRTRWSWGLTPDGGASTLTFGLKKTLQINQDATHAWTPFETNKIKWDDNSVMTFSADHKSFEVKMPDGSKRYGKLLGKVES